MAQHDYDIANQAGAAFRTDLNAAMAAIVSQNSGATAPAATFAGMWWFDTGNSIDSNGPWLRQRNSGNTGWERVLQPDLGLIDALQVQSYTAFTSAGTAPAYTLTPMPAIAAYVAGQRFRVKFHAAGTIGSNTINISGLGVKSIKQYDSTGVKVSGVIAINQLTDLEYDGTDVVILDPLPSRSGINTVTLTSAAPSATLTAGSNQLVVIASDATKALNPSITLPNMTTMSAGAAYFIFSNLTQYKVAIKDAGGTIRQFIEPGANQILNVKDASTANGVWTTEIPVVAGASDNANATVFNGWKVNAGWYIMATEVVKLTTSVFALVWAEYNNGNTVTYYAQPYTVNSAAKTVTQGTRITVGSITLAAIAGKYLSTASFELAFDSDTAGQALVALSISSYMYATAIGGFGVFGLSYSGGVLYASAIAATTYTGGNACVDSAGAKIKAISYLGSSSAYAVIFFKNDGNAGSSSFSQFFQGYTVTGTTTVTLTASASNTTSGTVGMGSPTYAARTGLTTFSANLQGSTKIAKALSYTPASNTFTVTTRTTTSVLDIEQGNTRDSCSFAAGGFMYCTGKVYINSKVWDITNAGAAGVTSVVSLGFSQKFDFSTGYSSRIGTQAPSVQSSIPVSGSSVLGYGSSVVSCDPSTSTFNINYSTGSTGDLMLDASLALESSISNTGTGASTLTGTLSAIPVDIAIPFKN
ncbi:MAG: hypothetical protein ACOYB1_09730 [Limnohabitans sp.]